MILQENALKKARLDSTELDDEAIDIDVEDEDDEEFEMTKLSSGDDDDVDEDDESDSDDGFLEDEEDLENLDEPRKERGGGKRCTLRKNTHICVRYGFLKLKNVILLGNYRGQSKKKKLFSN